MKTASRPVIFPLRIMGTHSSECTGKDRLRRSRSGGRREIVDQQRGAVFQHPAGQLVVEAEGQALVAGVADAADGLERPFRFLFLQQQHRALLGLQVVDAALGDQVEDLFQRQGGVDGRGDLVEDAQFLDRPLQA